MSRPCAVPYCQHLLEEHGPNGCYGVRDVAGRFENCRCRKFIMSASYQPPGAPKPQWEPPE